MVRFDTPASAAIASTLARAYPSRTNTASAARTIRARLSADPARTGRTAAGASTPCSVASYTVRCSVAGMPVLPLAVAIVIGALAPLLDMTMVTVALADLSQAFGAPLSTVQWVTTGYLLAIAAVIPATG